MAILKMDPAQGRAVETTGKDILVSASAGAGKTRVLVERLVKRCLQDQIPLDRILAVTFTKAAAGEMKDRVNRRLQEELQNATNPEEIAYLQEQLVRIDSAAITTIDSFCLTIIEKYYNVIGLDPSTCTNTLNGGISDAYLDQAYRATLQAYDLEHHESLIHILNRFSRRSEDYDSLRDLLKTILKHADSAADPEQWFQDARNASKNIHTLQDLPQGIRDGFWNQLELSIQEMTVALNAMKKYAADSEKIQKKQDLLTTLEVLFANTTAQLQARNYPMFRATFFEIGQAKTPTDSKAVEYTNARKSFYTRGSKLAELLYEESILIQDHNAVVQEIHTLLDLAEGMRIAFLKLKQENVCMDFADMERFALEILQKNHGAVSALYQAQFDEVMVDEFQDTSILQNTILELIARKGTIFRVGDVKQSIYRFRQAKPSLMRSMLEDPDMEQITLEHNYRSKENIVEYCNVLFSKLMNIPGCEDRYEERDTVSIGTDSQKLETPCPVQFISLPAKKDTTPDVEGSEESESNDESPSVKLQKAMWIAGEIHRLHESGAYGYENFSVLVRSHNDKTVLRTAFDAFGIPYDIDAREGFFKSSLCQTILSLLKVLINPMDTISLTSVLTSGLVRLDDSVLAELTVQYESLYQGVKAQYPGVLELLKEFRSIARKEGMCALLNAVANTNSFYQRLDASSKSNFDYLFEMTIQLETNTHSIHALITTMEASVEERSSDALNRSRDDNVVTVTTIHQSKGLQYKVVFLWSNSRNTNMDTKEPLLVDDELFLGIKAMNLKYRSLRPTIDRIAIAYKNNLEDLEEYTRVLYVALTRAEEQLYIVDTIDADDISVADTVSLPLLTQRKGMSGLILGALKEIPNLFQIVKTQYELPQNITPLPKKYASHLPHYHGDVQILSPGSTPSSFEITHLPELDLNQNENGTGYGTLMHEILAELPNTTWTREDLSAYPIQPTDQDHILAFANSELYQKALSMEIHHEFPFYLERDTIRMHGVMDFVAIGKEEILLIDYKTDSATPEEIRSRYSDQLNAYRSALEFMYPNKPVHTYAWSLHNSCEVWIPDPPTSHVS